MLSITLLYISIKEIEHWEVELNKTSYIHITSSQCRPSCGWGSEILNSQRLQRSGSGCTCNLCTSSCDNLPLTPLRMADVGSLLARVKMATKVFAIFATNASFLCLIANLQISFSIIYNMYHVIVHFLPKKHCFWPKRALFSTKDLQKVRKSRQILICDKLAYIRA